MLKQKHFQASMFLIVVTISILFIGLISVLTHSPIEAATIIFVDVNASGVNNGTSWGDAYTNLSTAISNATSGDEIWVADGVYTPGGSANDSFLLKDGVSIYGGFAGGEGSLGDRNWDCLLYTSPSPRDA